MLYTHFDMNIKPNVPEEIGFGKLNLWGSCRGSLKAGAAWMFVVYLTDVPGDWLTLAALFFAVSASFFVFLLWLRLEREGFFNAVFGPPFLNDTWGIATVAHACVLLGGFYGLGFLIFKRRFK